MSAPWRWLSLAWRSLRELSGDSAYERAVARAKRDGSPPPSREQYWLADLERRYGAGLRRCC